MCAVNPGLTGPDDPEKVSALFLPGQSAVSLLHGTYVMYRNPGHPGKRLKTGFYIFTYPFCLLPAEGSACPVVIIYALFYGPLWISYERGGM